MRQTVITPAYVEICVLPFRGDQVRISSAVASFPLRHPDARLVNAIFLSRSVVAVVLRRLPPPLIEVTFLVHVEISLETRYFSFFFPHPRRDTVANNLSVRPFYSFSFFFSLLSFLSSRRLPVNAVLFR